MRIGLKTGPKTVPLSRCPIEINRAHARRVIGLNRLAEWLLVRCDRLDRVAGRNTGAVSIDVGRIAKA